MEARKPNPQAVNRGLTAGSRCPGEFGLAHKDVLVPEGKTFVPLPEALTFLKPLASGSPGFFPLHVFMLRRS